MRWDLGDASIHSVQEECVHMSFISEFKEFAMKGNVVDMAVGIIIGAAFGKIISVLVDKVIMPPIGLLIGGVNFRDLAFTLKAAEGEQPAVVVGYGEFLQTVFDFTIIALAIFMMIKTLNKLKRQAPPPLPAAPPEATKEEKLLTEIRDILKSTR
jgi:large conductance mechanosensitive channel